MNNLYDLSDKELMALVKQDNEDAFAVLVERYENRIFNYIASYINDKEMANDIVQDAFVKLYLFRYNFDDRNGSFKGLLYTTAINLAKNYFRSKSKIRAISLDEKITTQKGDSFSWEIADKEQDTEKIVADKVKMDELRAALDKLSPKFKEIILLRDYEGYSYEEIADMLNISIGTVKSRINRGRNKIIKILEEMENKNK